MHVRLTGTPLGTDARRPVSGREKKKSWSASSASTLSPSLGLSRLLRHKRHELTATVAPSGRRFLSVERASLPQSAWFAFPPNLHPPPPSAGVELNRRWFDCRGGWLACLSYPPPLPLPSQSNLSVFPPFTDGPQKRALQSLGVVSVGVEGGRCTFSSITFILWVPSIASSLPKIGLPFLSNTFALFPPCSSLARSSPFWLTASREILLREARGGRPSR